MATIGEQVINWLGGVTPDRMQEVVQAAVETAANRAYEAGYFDGADGNDDPVSGDLKSFGYRQLTNKLRDFSKLDNDIARNTIWTLFTSSPVAKRIMEIKRDHIVGGGATFEAPNSDELQTIFDKFVTANKFGRLHKELAMQLFLLGEQVLPAFVRESDGRVLLGYIDPNAIDRVIHHPDNALELYALLMKPIEGVRKVYRLIRPDEGFTSGKRITEARHPGKLVTWEQATIQPWEQAMLKEHGLKTYSGSVFYARVNALSDQGRGVSDLLRLADWLDQLDETLFALGEREQIAGYFLTDVTLTDASKDQVRDKVKELAKSPPKRGSINVHNDREAWNVQAPDLGQAGSIATYLEQLTFVLGGVGFPRAWYGHGDGTNRATLSEQADPTVKSLEHDQGVVRDFFTDIFSFVRDQAEIAGGVWEPEEGDSGKVLVTMPAITNKDYGRIAGTLNQVTTSLVAGVQNQWITDDTARQVYAKLLSEFGVTIDLTAEKEQVEEEGEEEEETAVQAQNDTLNGKLKEAVNGMNNGLANFQEVFKVRL